MYIKKGNVMMMKDKRLSGEAGLFTLEAALIMPVVILTVIVAVFSGMVLCQQLMVQGCADRAAERGAEIWASPGSDAETGEMGEFNRNETSETNLYWRIRDKDKDEKIGQIKEYASELLSGKTVFIPTDTTIDVAVKNYLFYKELKVKVLFKFKLPVAGISLMFGGKGEVSVKAESVVRINEPAEFIRNTDFVIDIGKEIKEAFPQIDEIKNRINGELKDFLNNMFPKEIADEE